LLPISEGSLPSFVRVGATDGNTVRPGKDELFDGFGLFLGVLFVRRDDESQSFAA